MSPQLLPQAAVGSPSPSEGARYAASLSPYTPPATGRSSTAQITASPAPAVSSNLLSQPALIRSNSDDGVSPRPRIETENSGAAAVTPTQPMSPSQLFASSSRLSPAANNSNGYNSGLSLSPGALQNAQRTFQEVTTPTPQQQLHAMHLENYESLKSQLVEERNSVYGAQGTVPPRRLYLILYFLCSCLPVFSVASHLLSFT